MNRREFLQKSGLAIGAAAVLPLLPKTVKATPYVPTSQISGWSIVNKKGEESIIRPFAKYSGRYINKSILTDSQRGICSLMKTYTYADSIEIIFDNLAATSLKHTQLFRSKRYDILREFAVATNSVVYTAIGNILVPLTVWSLDHSFWAVSDRIHHEEQVIIHLGDKMYFALKNNLKQWFTINAEGSIIVVPDRRS